MKTLSQHLQQVFNALKFTNAGHLNALTEMLTPRDHSVTPAPTDRRAGRHKNSLEHVTNATASSH
jgi:hypothetical protein